LAVRIRLSRVGATKRPSYRVVAIDSRRPRDGRALEILGYYDPLTEPATVQIDTERFAVWVGKGALPSETVAKLIKLSGSAPAPAGAPAPKPARTRKPSGKATAKAKSKVAAEAPTETLAEVPAEAPTETLAEVPAETAAETQAETPAEAPAETAGEAQE
jgi:small subunit ribosomal protein S16